jgi:DNA-binding CsgD family transcriptional regulator
VRRETLSHAQEGVMQRVETMQQWTTSLAAATIHRLAMGIIIAAPDGRVNYLNRAAQDILAAEDGLMLRDQLLSARRSFETTRLHNAINQAAKGGTKGEDQAHGLLIARPSGLDPYLLLVEPLALEPSDVEFGSALALILVSDPEFRDSMLAARLARTFGLTGAETRLAAYLARGERLSSIAQETGLALSTLRAQLRAVFKKTETTRQADLVRIVLGMPMVRASQAPEQRSTPRSRRSL